MKRAIIFILFFLTASGLPAIHALAGCSELMRVETAPANGQMFQSGARVTVTPDTPSGSAYAGEEAFVLRGDAVFTQPPAFDYADGSTLTPRPFRINGGLAYVFRPQSDSTAFRITMEYGVVNGGDGALFKYMSNTADTCSAVKTDVYIPGITKLAAPASAAQTPAAPETSSFTDIAGHWGETEIDYAAAKNLVAGVTNTIFMPDAVLTRAQVAQILYNMCGNGENKQPAGYDDVSAGSWYAAAVAWTQSNGLIPDYERDASGRLEPGPDDAPVKSADFRPDEAISREDTVTAIVRLAGIIDLDLPKLNTEVRFPDESEIDPYADAAVKTAQMSGVITGRPVPGTGGLSISWLDEAAWDGSGSDAGFSLKFAPQGGLTRAEAAVIFDLFDEIKTALQDLPLKNG